MNEYYAFQLHSDNSRMLAAQQHVVMARDFYRQAHINYSQQVLGKRILSEAKTIFPDCTVEQATNILANCQTRDKKNNGLLYIPKAMQKRSRVNRKDMVPVRRYISPKVTGDIEDEVVTPQVLKAKQQALLQELKNMALEQYGDSKLYVVVEQPQIFWKIEAYYFEYFLYMIAGFKLK